MIKKKIVFACTLMAIAMLLTVPVKASEIHMVVAGNVKTHIDKIDFTQDYSIIDQIDKISILSKSEKQALKEEREAVRPHEQKIKKLEVKMRKISDKIMKGAEGLNNKYNTIYAINVDLWNKLDSGTFRSKDDNDKKMTNQQMVELSTSLNDDEKLRLIEDAKLLDDIDAKINAYYEKVDKATEKISRQIDKEYKAIEKISGKNADIWKKLRNSIESNI